MVNRYSVDISSADAGNQSQRQGLLNNASLRVVNILYRSIFLSQINNRPSEIDVEPC